ncbi:MAG: IMP dehydrogenase [Candidatus Methylacidiphilales bacterium]
MESNTAHPYPYSTSMFLDADAFFAAQGSMALTYDDVSLATNYSEILPRQTSLESRLSDSLTLPLPILSADMDTVTESKMAIAMALNGGMGLIHYNMSLKNQVKQVARVKNHIHGLIQDPITIQPGMIIGDVMAMIESKGYSFSTFPVVDEQGVLIGLLPGMVVKHRYSARKVSEAMTGRSELYTLQEKELGDNPVARADRFFNEHMGIHKILIVDEKDRLCGLFTLSDIEQISEEARSHQRPARDEKFRLRCGVAVSATRNSAGELDGTSLIQHVEQLVQEGVDVVAISTAHGFSSGVGEAVRLLRDAFPSLTLIAGNVTSGEGVRYLREAGADAVKVGQGPGSICTTRVVAGVGIPQLSALYSASLAARETGARLIADGGINKSGDIVKALTLADAVICGGMLAGCPEAPGKIIEINGKLYKEYRGMGSIEAMRAGSAARYGHEAPQAKNQQKVAAEGIEALKEVSASVDLILNQLAGGIQSGMGYLGAAVLSQLKEKARYVRVSPAGQKEASPHDVVEVKTTQS